MLERTRSNAAIVAEGREPSGESASCIHRTDGSVLRQRGFTGLFGGEGARLVRGANRDDENLDFSLAAEFVLLYYLINTILAVEEHRCRSISTLATECRFTCRW